jgi:FAD/FMN-containing dehydrogenase
VVTAEGVVVRAAEDEHPDLFWALRGGGGNFGVVTEFEFELRPFGPLVLAGMVLHALDDAPDALRHCRDFMEDAPDELTVFETFMTVPPEAPFPPALQGRPALAIALVYAGDPEAGARVVEPLRRFGRPALDLVGPMPPTAVMRMLDPTAPHGLHYSSRSHWLAALPDDAVDRLCDRHAGVTAPLSAIITARMGGAVARVAEGETAFGHRDAHRLLWVISAWAPGDDGERHAAWCRGVFDAMTPWSTGGVYVNAVDDEPASRVRAAYADGVWARLREAKAAWDPDNVFRLNPNIAPAQVGVRAA